MVADGSFPFRLGGKLYPIVSRRSDVAASGRGVVRDLGPEFVGGLSARYPSSRWHASTFRAAPHFAAGESSFLTGAIPWGVSTTRSRTSTLRSAMCSWPY